MDLLAPVLFASMPYRPYRVGSSNTWATSGSYVVISGWSCPPAPGPLLPARGSQRPRCAIKALPCLAYCSKTCSVGGRLLQVQFWEGIGDKGLTVTCDRDNFRTAGQTFVRQSYKIHNGVNRMQAILKSAFGQRLYITVAVAIVLGALV